jgi:hypothetical protein
VAASLGGLTQHVVMSHKDGTLVTTEITWRGHWSGLMHVWPPPSGFQVGSSGNHVTLQAETYHPVPLQDVSTEGQVERSVGGLALTVRSTVELNECGVSSPGFQVGSFQSRVMLQAETGPGPL